MATDPIIAAIKKRREAAGLTQRQLAINVGMSIKTYQRIESGATDLKLKAYRAIVTELQISDLDIALDMMGYREVTAEDVAAAARTMPAEMRRHLVAMIMAGRKYRRDMR